MKPWVKGLLSLVLTLGTAEVLARLFLPVDLAHPRDALIQMFQPDPETFWALRPGYTIPDGDLLVRWGGVPLVINSDGMRGPERPVKKPAGVKRVVVLGGSHPMGMWVKTDEAYAAVLERLLNERQPGRWEVLNAAVAGYTTWQGVLQMRHKIGPYEPDIVISDLGHNDGLARVAWGVSLPDERVREPPAPARFVLHLLHTRSAAYRFALKKVTERANREPLVRVSKAEHARNVREIERIAATYGARTLFMNQWIANVEAPGVASISGARCMYPEADLDPVVDVCGLFAGRDDLPQLFADALHANATGHAMIARAVLDKLVALGWVD